MGGHVKEQNQEPAPDAEIVEDQDVAKRKACLESFLAKNGFQGINSKRRRSFRPSTYPLHLAAENGDTSVLVALLEAKADANQRDSSNRTAAEVAQKKNRKGSHDEVIALLS